MICKSQKRTALIKKNIFYSFFIKGWSGIVQILLVPVTLFCLGSYENGIWMTISSILVWIDNLDIGLGNGMRNRLASQIASCSWEDARTTVSSTFGMLVMLVIPIAILLIFITNILDIYSLLNIDRHIVDNLTKIVMMSIALVSATFVFKFIGNLYTGMQLPAINNALVTLGQTLILTIVFVLKCNNIHSLFLVAIAYTASPLLVYLIAYPITFNKVYPKLKPSIHYFKWFAVKDLLSLGLEFFILQIAGIILVSCSNILISRVFSPAMVTPFQVSYKYFGFALLLFNIIVTPFWSATTDAYSKKDFNWIKESMLKIQKIILLIAVLLFIMILFSKIAYQIWIGNSVSIPTMMSVLTAVYIFEIVYSMSYSYILNGLGLLRIQILFTICAALLYIPIASLLSKGMGINGMILALIIVNFPGLLANKTQFYYFLKQEENGKRQ